MTTVTSNAATKRISIVVPFLNEERNLPLLYRELCEALDQEPQVTEFLFVDDGSADGSAAWLLQARQQDSRIRLVQLSRNFGHQAALSAGFDLAQGDAVVTLDSDLQDPPAVIPRMLQKWREGYEVVYAVRSRRAGENLLKKACAAFFYRFFRRCTRLELPLDAGDFRVLDAKVVAVLRNMRETHRLLRAMTTWVGFRQCAVEYERRPRSRGHSKYAFVTSLKLAWDGLTSFSDAPLRWILGLGLSCALLAVATLLLSLLYAPLQTYRPTAILIAVILFVGALQLVSLSLLGQYIYRIFEQTKSRPLYVVSFDSANPNALGQARMRK